MEQLLNRILETVERTERILARRHTDIIVSCSEAARLLNVSRSTISNWVEQGKLHKVTKGDSTGIMLTEIRDLMD